MRAWLAGLLTAVALTAITACGDSDEQAAPVPPQTSESERSRVGDGSGGVSLRKLGEFEQPLYVVQAPGSEDLYVVEKPGRVQLLRGGSGQPAQALDISHEVSDQGEQGLLSIAFAPDAGSRLLYAYFTDSAGDQRIVEYRLAEDGTIEEASRRELLKMDDSASNHNGGLMLFGPDGLLYVGTGDGGRSEDAPNGQDLGLLLGKILRIDPVPSGGSAYGVPEDNPFAGRKGARGEVFAYGLRNPWRFSFDRETGDLLIGDVGGSMLEEVDLLTPEQAPGANLGWPAFEGTERLDEDLPAPGHVEPVLTYPTERGCSITGGYVVRDPGLPTLLGRYLYGDYCSGELRSFEPARGRARGDRPLGLNVPGLSSFGEDSEGRIYATSLEGPVFQLVP